MNPKSNVKIVALSLCVLTAFSTVDAGAQTTQPNLSGTWKMNVEKSKFERGGPSDISITFDHKDGSLSESLTLTNDSGPRTVDLKYTTDGKATSQVVMGGQAQTFAKWDGKTLTIEWSTEGRSMSRSFTPSGDGKAMTMIVKQSGGDGQATTETIVLQKQETKK